ncbi:MAG: imidazole glycerol phosphate synthase subunit HisH [Verrucomicrobia bacterium]|nr:imidazole glycerol phosphate synthase subunit HisH [Verrucomicrobiota bacterium]
MVESSRTNHRPRVAVVDYGMGNLRSVTRALMAVGADAYLAATPRLAETAEAVVFPGQGAIADCMDCLKSTHFDGFLREWIASDRPFLGVCLGLQALFERSEEGNCAGLGIFPGVITRFPSQGQLRIPHMGWNEAVFKEASPLTAGLRVEGEPFYFVHSYRLVSTDPSIIWCETDYAGQFVSGVRRGRVMATQFHPEKSQVKGLQMYRNFLTLTAR